MSKERGRGSFVEFLSLTDISWGIFPYLTAKGHLEADRYRLIIVG
jgi:hypothetical protein